MKTFELKQEHLDLLKNTYIGWSNCEFGAPEIDPKRPYGNSFVVSDIIEILGWDDTTDEDGYYLEDVESEASELHYETEFALQIILQLQTFKLGQYINKADYGQEWQFFEEE